ncbi:NF-kappa-B inhibitor zeta-like [Amblyraja radiata]|uniref:NF-kappa-B inhibitor zeta-like n=1 Tax=Amblyraja radiata TaxID=386614 RepID=UPI001402629F|nr:NF-kappa-B inhibitor zeta-like [Amblyraja radiata]
MLFKVSSPDSLHDQSSNDSGIDDCLRRSKWSPAAIPSQCPQLSPSSPTPTVYKHCKRERRSTPEAANKIRAGTNNQSNLESQKKYLGVRVRLPVRDLLRNYRKARGEEPKSSQADAACKLNNERRRVVKDLTHSRPCSAKGNKQRKKIHVWPPRNFEDLFEDLVEVLELDLKQGGTCPLQRQIEVDCPPRCYMGCPFSLRDLHSRNQRLPALQTEDAPPDLESASHKPYPGSECQSWHGSPGGLVAFGGESCVNMADEARPVSHHHCYSQDTKHQSHPHSPSSEAKEFGQAVLSIAHSCKLTRGEPTGSLEASKQQYSPGSSVLSFFQFQLQQLEGSLASLSAEDILSVDKNGNTLLHCAVIQGKRAHAYSLACRMSDMNRIDTKDPSGQTALHLAAERNQHLMVNDLISLGAQINERDFLGRTPVHLCAENGFLRVLQVIERILKNGTDVDIDARDNHCLTPLHYAVLAHITTVKEFENSEKGSDLLRFLELRKEQLLDGMKSLLRMGSSLSMQV